MTTTVFIDGAVGTTGLEIAERLAGRSEFALITLDEARRKDDAARREAINDADVVILCLPDDAARDAVAMIANDRTRVIDASTAHRVAEGWTYGFPEIVGRDTVAEAKRELRDTLDREHALQVTNARLNERLDAARARQAPQPSALQPKGGLSGMAAGLKIASEFIAGVVVGVLLTLSATIRPARAAIAVTRMVLGPAMRVQAPPKKANALSWASKTISCVSRG